MNIITPIAKLSKKRFKTIVLQADGSTFTTFSDSPTKFLVYPKFVSTLSEIEKKDRYFRLKKSCYSQEKYESIDFKNDIVLQDKNTDILEKIKNK